MIKINWSQFKSLLDKDHIRARYVATDGGYSIHGADQGLIYTCDVVDGESDLTDFEDNYKDAIDAQKVASVKTQFERDDIVLKLAMVSGQADANGDVVLSIQVPGTPGSEVRYAAGGYAFTDSYSWTDKITKVEVVDDDNLIGFGAGAVLKVYHDSDADEANQGWPFWKTHGNEGECEIEPMGWYGVIPSGLYLKITCKVAASAKVKTCIWWGRVE